METEKDHQSWLVVWRVGPAPCSVERLNPSVVKDEIQQKKGKNYVESRGCECRREVITEH